MSKPSRHVLYKLCWDRRRGVYHGHRLATTLKAARRAATGRPDLIVLEITKGRSRDVTNKVTGRGGPNPFIA